MNSSRERFLDLMKNEILKLDLADLDFGIYRILNYRRAEIEAFFDEELPAALDKAMTGEEDESEFAQSEEDRLYNALYTFFSRYYRDGDFQPQQRRARDARYSVPYNGEDVHFHWRSKGSHYIKTTEELKSYAFRSGGWRVRFELREAFQDPDNVKGTTRYFIPEPDACRTEVGEDGNLFVVPFAFRKLTVDEDKRYGRKSDTIDGDSTQERLINDVGDGIETPDGVTKTDLLRHMQRYARKNRTDYFVHPHLGEFLRGELDYYLKNEFLDIDSLTSADAMADRLMKMRAVREVANRIIDMLDEIESFQARLFEKRKFVLSNSYLVPIRMVPEELWDDVLASAAQIEQWRSDFGLRGRIGRKTLAAHPTLVVDTSLLNADFAKRLLLSIDDISGTTDGVLVSSENFAALRGLLPRFGGSVKLVYIDPPYNTGGDGFLYRDEFSQHSAWLALMDDRLRLGRGLLSQDGAMFVSIDDNEHANLKEAADAIFGVENHLTSMVWEGGLKNDSRYISVGHDYIVGYLKNAEHVAQTGVRWRTRKEGIDDIYEAVENLVAQHGADYVAVSSGLKQWYSVVGKTHPAYAHRHYRWVDNRGVYFASDISWPGGGGPTYEVLHPTSGKPVVVPNRGWVYPSPERMAEKIADGRVHFGPDETSVPTLKRYLHETEGQVLPSVFYRDRRASTKELRQILGGDDFDNPKDVETLKKLTEATTSELSWVADYFAGSGSTGHAVIQLNREIGGLRRFILVDMGQYFDSVLKRRIAKVMYAPDWKDGRPRDEPEFTHDVPEWVERSPRLVQVMKLESYEDSLNSLLVGDDDQLGSEHRIRYVIPDSVEDSPVLLATERLEAPFDYQLEVHTDEGVEYRDVDLVTTFNLIKGIHMKRYRELNHDGRRYVVVEGTDAGKTVLVLWRSIAGLDPEAEVAFLNETIPEALGIELADYDVVWHNADSAIPKSMSLDAEFKRLMFEPEPALS